MSLAERKRLPQVRYEMQAWRPFSMLPEVMDEMQPSGVDIWIYNPHGAGGPVISLHSNWNNWSTIDDIAEYRRLGCMWCHCAAPEFPHD
jgi:hypothetical protein